MKCLNCNREFENKFCPNCGQKSTIKRITGITILADTIDSLSNLNKGYLRDLKELTISPRKFILGYLAGKRINVYKPISYVLVNITLYILIDEFVVDGKLDFVKELAPRSFPGIEFFTLYTKYLWILLLFFLSFWSKLFIQRFNYFEHLTINSFILAHVTLISIIYLFFGKPLPILFNPIIWVGITLYYFIVFYKVINTPRLILLSTTIYLISGFIFFAFVIQLSKIFG